MANSLKQSAYVIIIVKSIQFHVYSLGHYCDTLWNNDIMYSMDLECRCILFQKIDSKHMPLNFVPISYNIMQQCLLIN